MQTDRLPRTTLSLAFGVSTRKPVSSDRVYFLSQTYIKKCQPILKRLQGEPEKNQSDSECAKPSLGKIIRVVFDVRIHRHSHAGDQARDQPHANRKRPRVIRVMDERATNQRRDHIAHSTNHRSPKLTTRQPWTPRCCIVDGRTHAARVGEYLAHGYEHGKWDCESETQNLVQSSSE